MKRFELHAPYEPAGDQPAAIARLSERLRQGRQFQTLLGVTGSGKTFTIASLLASLPQARPTLIVSQNKTLAAQLYSEFRHFFPNNRVEYFVSYYDYYQPESYLPTTDTYIAKDSAVNDEIEKFRLAATASLLERQDVIVIASVSCIYGLGTPQEFLRMAVELRQGAQISRRKLADQLIEAQYERNDTAPSRGAFAMRGDTLSIHPSYRDDYLRVEFFGDEIESISVRDALSHKKLETLDRAVIFPATHYATGRDTIERVIPAIIAEMKDQVRFFEDANRLVEAQRLFQRTSHDIEMLRELGYCQGIENYSRYLTGRRPGSAPVTLLDFFGQDFLLVVDESHVTLPQFRGMYNGDQARKSVLVDYGFRLPSAKDNRPLRFEEFEERMPATIFVSATPAEYELAKDPEPVHLVARPTGLLDPIIEIRPLTAQVDDVIAEIRATIAKGQRVLVTCLTKKHSEKLADYLKDIGIKSAWLHSDVDAVERIDILRELRSGIIDVLIGINLLREGVDLPEVSLVAVLDADKEGFLRSETALIQVSGRAARHCAGRCILYADVITGSIRRFLDISSRRRQRQMEYNATHGITPRSVERPVQHALTVGDAPSRKKDRTAREQPIELPELPAAELLPQLQRQMIEAASNLEFERAAQLRDYIKELQSGVKPSELSQGRQRTPPVTSQAPPDPPPKRRKS